MTHQSAISPHMNCDKALKRLGQSDERSQLRSSFKHGFIAMRARNLKGVAKVTAFACASIALSLGQTPATAADLAPFEVEYDVGNNMISAGSATLQLSKEGDEWIYSLKTTPTGVFKLTGKGRIQEVSVFSVVDENGKRQLRPQRYTYRQDEESRRSVDAWFDWNDKQLTYKRRGEEVTEEFSDPLLDRLSVTLAVMDELRENNFQQAEIQVFDNGRVKNMIFTNEGTETVNAKSGKVETIRVRSKAAGGGTRHTVTWFAPDLDFVPVKIEQFKRDKLVARLTLTRLTNRPTQ